jgi:hypothetical protein
MNRKIPQEAAMRAVKVRVDQLTQPLRPWSYVSISVTTMIMRWRLAAVVRVRDKTWKRKKLSMRRKRDSRVINPWWRQLAGPSNGGECIAL